MLVLSVVLLVLPLLVDGQVSQFSAYQEVEEVQNPRAARATLSNALPQDLVSGLWEKKSFNNEFSFLTRFINLGQKNEKSVKC